MLRFIPPAGTPLGLGQIVRAVRTALVVANGRKNDSLGSLASLFSVRHAWGVSSGRAALWVILKALHQLRSDRCIVALPAYTCFTVPAAIVRAGLELYPVDIEPETLDFNFSQLEALPEQKLLCILTANLFGLLNDVSRVQQIARGKEAFVVDDAAQALGAFRAGHPAGTLGDVGFYSLGRGKALAAMEGGIIVTNSDEIARAIHSETRVLLSGSFFHNARLLAEMLAYSAFLKPRLYWIPNSLPFLKLGVTEFDPSFPIRGLTALTRGILPGLMENLTEVNEVRKSNAATITQALIGIRHFTTPKPAPDCQPTYIRFPLLAKDENARNRAVQSLQAIGIGARVSYPSAVCDIPGIHPHMASKAFHRPQAEQVAKKLLTVPVHPLVCQQDLTRIVNVLRDLDAND
jgi:dTDP-4-amino-4,6-dideoxygalactose transaminase